MIRLSYIIKKFESSFLALYQGRLLPSHRKALSAMKICRTEQSPVIATRCEDCDEITYIPHSCGHRHCPHCQSHGSSRPSMASTAFRLLSIRANNGLSDN